MQTVKVADPWIVLAEMIAMLLEMRKQKEEDDN